MTAAEVERSPRDVGARPDLSTLVDRARAGDPGAWEDLYQSMYPRLLAYASRQIGPDRARDAVGETMTRAVANIGRFSWRGAGFEGWLFAILRNVIIDVHRRDRRSSPFAFAVADRHDGSEPSDGLVADEEARALRAAFARLRPDEQELLYLRVVAGLSSEEVAGVLGKRRGAVRMAQSRALDRLRCLLREGDA